METKWQWTWESGKILTGYGDEVCYRAVVRKKSNGEIVGVRADDGQEFKKSTGINGDGKFYPLAEFSPSPDKIMSVQACRRKDDGPHRKRRPETEIMRPATPNNSKVNNKPNTIYPVSAEGKALPPIQPCTRCKEYKTLEAFGKNQTWCRKCHAEYQAERRANNSQNGSVECDKLERAAKLLDSIDEYTAEVRKILRAR